jgi:ABC-2 type transport system permease protein
MKQIGSFNDYLMSPISRIEIFVSLILSSLFVCVFIGIINLILLAMFTNFQDINYFRLFYYLILSIIIFSSIGAVTGFLSFTWDVQSTVSNFVIVPISLLSGTFFSIDSLTSNWKIVFEYNPFYYLVSGFRGAFLEKNILITNADILTTMITILILLISLFIFNKGYKVIN